GAARAVWGGLSRGGGARGGTPAGRAPPLHEFLPHTGEEMANLARDLGVPELELRRKVEGLREFNPMLGHRGSRLAVTYPEIYEIQVRAIVEAACVCADQGVKTHPEIMLPLVAGARELRLLRE